MCKLRNPARIDYINHILMMRKIDEAYAREAFKFYDKLMPWLELGRGIKKALSDKIQTESYNGEKHEQKI